jgi:DNA-binding IclR family transcriptional regulator
MLRSRPEAGARALAQEHGLAPRAVSRRLLHLNALGLVRADRNGLWTVVDPA